jgi:protoporphyrin/coproporphyrin ferrochelatase
LHKHAVILANLGAPETLQDIRPFLKNLFMDRDIVEFPLGKMGQRLFSSLISLLRAPKSAQHYELIGGGSPLQQQTELQAKALQKALQTFGNYTVYTAQRYWHPFFEETANQIWKDSVQKITLIPLYPQYSTTTTQSIINHWRRQPNLPEPQIVWRFYSDTLYLQAVKEQILEAAEKFSAKPHLLYSAHSIPVRRIKAGDSYQTEIESHVELLQETLEHQFEHSLAWQSKVGPVEWIGPSVKETLQTLREKGVERLLVVPLSFVSENLETLYELDIEYKECALKIGFRQYERAATVQEHPYFIECLKNIITGEKR